jgi:hypothetical protein
MDRLYLQKTQLEELVEDFKINNEGYFKVRENVKQEVESTIANPKQFLKWALSSLIEFLRKDPDKFQLLYYQMSTETSSQLSTSINDNQYYSVSYMGQQYPSQDYKNPTEAFENFVLNEAEKLYEKLLEDSIDKTISNIPNDSPPNVHSASVLCRTEPFDIKNNLLQRK